MGKLKIGGNKSKVVPMSMVAPESVVEDQEGIILEPDAEFTEVVDEGEFGELNEAEKQAIHAQINASQSQSAEVSTDRMNRYISAVREMFRIPEGYAVTSFVDKGSKKMALSLSNPDVSLTVVCTDPEKYGIYE